MNGLSSRLRSSVECAPWVFEAVQQLEAESARHLERLESALGQNARLISDNQRLREELRMAEVFHRLAVKERDYERVLNEGLDKERAHAVMWNGDYTEELSSLRGQVERLRADAAELLDTLHEVMAQACQDKGEYDTCALSAYCDGLDVLEKHGRVTIMHNVGRRSIAIDAARGES